MKEMKVTRLVGGVQAGILLSVTVDGEPIDIARLSAADRRRLAAILEKGLVPQVEPKREPPGDCKGENKTG